MIIEYTGVVERLRRDLNMDLACTGEIPNELWPGSATYELYQTRKLLGNLEMLVNQAGRSGLEESLLYIATEYVLLEEVVLRGEAGVSEWVKYDELSRLIGSGAFEIPVERVRREYERMTDDKVS